MLEQHSKKITLGLSLIFSLSSCQQQEFYEKEYLEEINDAQDLVSENSPAPVETTPSTPVLDPAPSTPSTPAVDPVPSTPSTPVVDPTPVPPSTPVVEPTPTTPVVEVTPSTPPVVTGPCSNGTLQDIEDSFVQNSAQEAKVDILWVVDNSGSMGDEQQALAQNFESFISNFIKRKTDFQMAITTTDPRSSHNGELVGDPSQLTSQAAQADEAQFLSNFKEQIMVGTKGSGTESGLNASYQFFKKYQDWARTDAYLVVVYVSDEEDSSSLSVKEYSDELKSLKTNEQFIQVYSIVTTQLIPGKKWETIGSRYIEHTQNFGGSVADIHQDFHQTLSDFGGKILNLIDSFKLSGSPLADTLQISVDNATLANGWNYNESNQTISFDQNAIPAEGSIISAEYQQCSI